MTLIKANMANMDVDQRTPHSICTSASPASCLNLVACSCCVSSSSSSMAVLLLLSPVQMPSFCGAAKKMPHNRDMNLCLSPLPKLVRILLSEDANSARIRMAGAFSTGPNLSPSRILVRLATVCVLLAVSLRRLLLASPGARISLAKIC